MAMLMRRTTINHALAPMAFPAYRVKMQVGDELGEIITRIMDGKPVKENSKKYSSSFTSYGAIMKCTRYESSVPFFGAR
jgi:hypothetical protein